MWYSFQGSTLNVLLRDPLERIFSFFLSLSAIPRELIQHSDSLTQGAGDWHLPQELIRPIMSPWCAVIAPHCRRPCAYRGGCASVTVKAYPPTIALCCPAIAARASFFLVALSHIHITLVVVWRLQQPVVPPSWLIFQPCQPFLHKPLD